MVFIKSFRAWSFSVIKERIFELNNESESMGISDKVRGSPIFSAKVKSPSFQPTLSKTCTNKQFSFFTI